jgi:hypothetical protein
MCQLCRTHATLGSNTGAGEADEGEKALHIGAVDAARVPDGGVGGAARDTPAQGFVRLETAAGGGEDARDEGVAAAEGVDGNDGGSVDLPFQSLPRGDQGRFARREEDDGDIDGEGADGAPGPLRAPRGSA